MSRDDVETYSHRGAWHNRLKGTDRVLSTHPTKDEAETVGRRVAITLQVEHIIQEPDGQSASRRSYRPETD